MRVAAILAFWFTCAALEAAWSEEPPPKVALHEGKPTSHWIAELQKEDVFARRKAAHALFKLGAPAKAAAPLLARAFEDEDEYVRDTAYAALIALGEDARPAVKALRSALNDGRARVRKLALWALLRIDPRKVLRDEDVDVRKAGLTVLADPNDFLNEAVFLELPALTLDDDAEIRTWAARAVATAYRHRALERPYLIPEKASLVETMCRIASGDEEPLARHGAVYALLSLARYPKGRDASERIRPNLIAATRDDSPEVRSMAFTSLSATGKSDEAERACMVGVKDEDAMVRAAAARRLSSVGEGGPHVVAALIAVLDDEDRFVRFGAAEALGWFSVKSASAVPALRERLRVEKYPGAFAKALGDIGSAARPALPQLEAGFATSQRGSAEFAYALLRLGAPNQTAALDRLVEVALSDDGGGAQAYLGELGAVAAPAVPRIVEALSKGESAQRRQAARTLSYLGPIARSAVPTLEALLKKDALADKDLEVAVREAIKKIRRP